MDDLDVMQKASGENRILIANDKDFGERIHRERRPHRGGMLLRLDDERSGVKIDTIRRLLAAYPDQLADQYVVVSEERVRFARMCQQPGGKDEHLPRPPLVLPFSQTELRGNRRISTQRL